MGEEEDAAVVERALFHDPDIDFFDDEPTATVHYPGTPQDPKPMVTREQYRVARAVLDALPPGLYVKCSVCGGWQHGGTYVVRRSGEHLTCEKCRG